MKALQLSCSPYTFQSRPSRSVASAFSVALRCLSVVMFLFIVAPTASAGDSLCADPNVWPETVVVESAPDGVNLILGPAVVIGDLINSTLTIQGFLVTYSGTPFDCIIGTPPTPATVTLALGPLPPGLYQLRIVYRGQPGGDIVQLRSFVVAGNGVADPSGIPLLDARGLLLLLLGLAATGLIALRARR